MECINNRIWSELFIILMMMIKKKQALPFSQYLLKREKNIQGPCAERRGDARSTEIEATKAEKV